jgi:carbonic anhydrase
VAGNVMDKLALGSIDYAVEHLHPCLLLVMGHQSCGAVNAGAHLPHATHAYTHANTTLGIICSDQQPWIEQRT